MFEFIGHHKAGKARFWFMRLIWHRVIFWRVISRKVFQEQCLQFGDRLHIDRAPITCVGRVRLAPSSTRRDWLRAPPGATGSELHRRDWLRAPPDATGSELNRRHWLRAPPGATGSELHQGRMAPSCLPGRFGAREHPFRQTLHHSATAGHIQRACSTVWRRRRRRGGAAWRLAHLMTG